MASPAGTFSSCSTQRGASRRSWNGRERDVLHSRCRSLPPRRRVITPSRSRSTCRGGGGSSTFDGQSAASEELKPAQHHENLTGSTGRSSRIRVGVRIRPPFVSEVDYYQKRSGGYRPAVKISRHGCVDLIANGRQRSFPFDYAFDATCQQRELYQRHVETVARNVNVGLAAPVVDGCLTGFNGLIMAYGQTASGKSHSMGVLRGVDLSEAELGKRRLGGTKDREPPFRQCGMMNGAQISSHNQTDPGIIPRALSRVFEHVQASSVSSDGGTLADVSVKVKVSLLQIYNETVQDLLTPTAPFGGENNGLIIRENPSLGFYVEGLREYSVRSHEEVCRGIGRMVLSHAHGLRFDGPASIFPTSTYCPQLLYFNRAIGKAAELINLGLQQRTTSRTTKNDISSRSHTVLTVSLDQPSGIGLFSTDPEADVADVARQHAGSRGKSKLVLVDLAGSERGRTSCIYAAEEPEAVRLREAGYINQSLSALGNVVAALGQAELDRPHIPFRDSKLTRILADSLGGDANAALVATVGPAPQNQAETLSTLVFASRCMRVQSNPVRHEEHEEMELSSMQREFCRREALQQSRYEIVVTRLAQELEHARKQASSGRTAQRLPDQEAPAAAAPLMKSLKSSEEVHAREETPEGTTFRRSAFVSDASENGTWNDSKCCPAVTTGSSADGQTDDADSMEGDERRAGAFCPEKPNDVRSAENIPESRGGTSAIEAGSAAWEMIGAALRALEGVGQKGAEVLRQARHASDATPVDRCGRQARTDESSTLGEVASETIEHIPRNKVQILQRLTQSRKLCEEQWVEAGQALSSALRETARLLSQTLRRHKDHSLMVMMAYIGVRPVSAR
ncbi:unnamed protein product [Ectocarpus sp. CCAP 1310/34]|nr:unnamed protein product [Ectocarpus sp. CCAP 1310/34]